MISTSSTPLSTPSHTVTCNPVPMVIEVPMKFQLNSEIYLGDEILTPLEVFYKRYKEDKFFADVIQEKGATLTDQLMVENGIVDYNQLDFSIYHTTSYILVPQVQAVSRIYILVTPDFRNRLKLKSPEFAKILFGSNSIVRKTHERVIVI